MTVEKMSCLRLLSLGLMALLSVAALSLAADSGSAEPGDWPQFHGPNRDAQCGETGLLQQWPEGGPELLWKAEGLGKGYFTVSIASGRIFTMGDRKPPGDEESQFVIALDLDSRKELWATRVGPPHRDGPRCTPTVCRGHTGDGKLYLRDQDVLMCYDVAAR